MAAQGVPEERIWKSTVLLQDLALLWQHLSCFAISTVFLHELDSI